VCSSLGRAGYRVAEYGVGAAISLEAGAIFQLLPAPYQTSMTPEKLQLAPS
jgi:hypothetical protein